MTGSREVRGGFTLLEIVIVAAVIATLAAATVPTITALMGREAIMQSRGELADFLATQRRTAIDSANVRWLRWEADGHHVIAGVDGQPADQELALPDEVQIAENGYERLDDRIFDNLSDSSLADAGWSSEVVFYPDGRATQTTLTFDLPPRTETITVHHWSGVIE